MFSCQSNREAHYGSRGTFGHMLDPKCFVSCIPGKKRKKVYFLKNLWVKAAKYCTPLSLCRLYAHQTQTACPRAAASLVLNLNRYIVTTTVLFVTKDDEIHTFTRSWTQRENGDTLHSRPRHATGLAQSRQQCYSWGLSSSNLHIISSFWMNIRSITWSVFSSAFMQSRRQREL